MYSNDIRLVPVADLKTAQDLIAKVDGALGFPITPTEADRRGGGIHVPFEQARTLTSATTRTNPTTQQLAVVLETKNINRLSNTERASAVTDDGTWEAKAQVAVAEPIVDSPADG